jgi:hypothetical protein
MSVKVRGDLKIAYLYTVHDLMFAQLSVSLFENIMPQSDI